MTAVELGHLKACLDLFAAHDRAQPMMAEQPERDRGLADVFRRVLKVLLLPPPQRLLTMPCGPSSD